MSESVKEPVNEEIADEALMEDITQKSNTEGESDTEASAKSEEEARVEAEEAPIDYEELMKSDMRELISLFPQLYGKSSITELDNPLRYAALRDLGLSPKEAYLATATYPPAYNNRSHLQSAVPRAAGTSPDILGAREMEAARELFSGLSDREIQKLYKKVSK